METDGLEQFPHKGIFWIFVLIQISVMLFAISNESLWIDEFWSAGFALKDNLQGIIEQLSNKTLALTPLHYIYFYFWRELFGSGEMMLRLANLPLFVMGQSSLFWALRAYPKLFSYLFLTLCAVHPMVWQYANEARPYMMMYAGSEMILAYLFYIHCLQSRDDCVAPLFSGILVLGCILLAGASMLGGFWVYVAIGYVAYFHYRFLNFTYLKKKWLNIFLASVLLLVLALLSFLYVRNVLSGGSASILSGTQITTLAFDAYELMGLSGIGPGRLELREAGISALGGYWIWLILAAVLVTFVLLKGSQHAVKLIGHKRVIVLVLLSSLPALIVIVAGFITHWRVLGRHLIGMLPAINLLFALGMASLLDRAKGGGMKLRSAIACIFLLMLIFSSFSMRFAERHRKDDYRGATAIARQEMAQGRQVWWAAFVFGAGYYGIGELGSDEIFSGNGAKISAGCVADTSGFQAVFNESRDCLESLPFPDVVILSKLDVFDGKGELVSYLRDHGFVKQRTLPAFTIWRPAEASSLRDSALQ